MELMTPIIAGIMALEDIAHIRHWALGGQYGGHLLWERVYNELAEVKDQLVEVAIGTTFFDPRVLLTDRAQILNEWASHAPLDFEFGLGATSERLSVTPTLSSRGLNAALDNASVALAQITYLTLSPTAP